MNRKESIQNSPKAPQFGNMKKLMPSPITTLSSTSSTSFRGHSVRNSTDFSNMNQTTSSQINIHSNSNQRGIKSPTLT